VSQNPDSAPELAPALIVFTLGIPAFVILGLAVVLNWGR
jgi:hypothetical protein